MKNLKIKVNGNVDELVDLFKQLGCRYFNHTGSVSLRKLMGVAK